MKVIIRKKKSSYALFQLFGILILVDLVIGFIIFTSFQYDGISGFDELLVGFIFLSLPLLLNLYLINYIFWQLRGYEIVEMNEKTLSIKRMGKLFNDSSMISTNKIELIKDQKKYDPSKFGDSIWINPFLFSEIAGEEGGKIRVIYKTKIFGFSFKISTFFGQGLSNEEALMYVQQMNKILSALDEQNF